MTTTVVHLLRHGKVHNPGRVLYGRLPGFELSASGRAMAEGVADHLATRSVTDLAASSLIRAQQTAAPLGTTLGLEVRTDDRLLEAVNDFEGQRMTTWQAALRRRESWSKMRDPFRPSWGEPYLDIAHRMLAAVYAAVDRAAGREAVLVSHQLPIVIIRRFLTGQRLWHDPRRRQCNVASLTSLSFVDGVFDSVTYAEPVAHIAASDDPVDPVQAGA